MSKENVTRTILERYTDLFMGFVFAISLLAATGWVVNKPILVVRAETFFDKTKDIQSSSGTYFDPQVVKTCLLELG